MELTPQQKKIVNKELLTRIYMKYEIIKYYESIEYKGRGAKEETRKKFDLASISSKR